MKKFHFFILFFFSTFIFSQNINQQIADIPANFFDLNREIYHLQFSKNDYYAGETIWFKGFVFDKKTNLLSKSSFNVSVKIYDSQRNLIKTQLHFSIKGKFDGSYNTNKDLNSGIYYFQVFSNNANNFNEDESYVFKTEIINPDDGKVTTANVKPIIEFSPEGAVFLEGVNNTIGISIKDCFGNGIVIKEGKVLDDNNIQVNTFYTNILGDGKFQINATQNKIYKISFDYNKHTITTNLPLPVSKGLTLNVNTISSEENLLVSIATNAKSFEEFKNKKFYVLFNQNQYSNIAEFILDKPEKSISISKDKLADGVNYIRIIDENLNETNKRLVFNRFLKKFDVALDVFKTKKDSITCNILAPNPNFTIGLSLLPENSTTNFDKSSIINSLYIKSYINDDLFFAKKYIENNTRQNNFELDVFMLNATNDKYSWNEMKNKPVDKFKNNVGIKLKGKINEVLDKSNKYQVQLFSFINEVNEFAEINEKNEFEFKNLIATDSTKLNLTLIKNGSKYKALKYFPNIINEDGKFVKQLKINTANMDYSYDKLAVKQDEIVYESNITLLNDVVLDTEKKEDKLNKLRRMGGFNLKGTKISDDDYNMYRDVLGFLQGNGFDAGTRNGTVYVKGRGPGTITRSNIPNIFLDDVQLDDFGILESLLLSSIDEIYINKRGMSIDGSGFGVIKIYSKTGSVFTRKKVDPEKITIKNGFSPINEFVLNDYTNYQSESFKKNGTIFWSGNLESTSTLSKVYFKDTQQKKIRILIEGISDDGEYVSEIKEVEIP